MHHSELTDSQFEQAFENATLDPVMFNHKAHLRLAWIHVSKYVFNSAQAKQVWMEPEVLSFDYNSYLIKFNLIHYGAVQPYPSAIITNEKNGFVMHLMARNIQ